MTPIIILGFLSAAFVLGLSLGWVIWRFGQAGAVEKEVTYWKERFDQSRTESYLKADRVAELETERDTLRKRVRAMSDKKKS